MRGGGGVGMVTAMPAVVRGWAADVGVGGVGAGATRRGGYGSWGSWG